MKFPLVFLLLLFAALDSPAFNRENHRLISMKAIELLQEKYGADYLSQEEISLIIKGNLSEESFNFKSFIRPFNKHYINPNKDSALWKRDQSIDTRYQRLVIRFYKRRNSPKYNYSIGEIIHFIQDAASPLHVVPIAHSENKDHFESQDIQNLLPEEFPKEEYLYCTQNYPLYLLETLAKKTLSNINQKFPVQIGENGNIRADSLDWSSFWKVEPDTWMGEYGMLGKTNGSEDNFLQEEISAQGKNYRISPSTYEDFSKEQLELAVLYTARFIYFAKTLVNEEGEVINEYDEF